MPRYSASFIALGALATLSSGRLAAAPESPRPPAASVPARALDPQLVPPTISRPSVPLRFEPLPASDNGTRVFVARSAGYAVHVGPTWAEVHATARPGAAATSAADPIAMRFVGAAAGPREVSLEGAATTVNYLVGADLDGWRLGLEARARVRFRDVYPGIDVAYYGTDREVEYDVLLEPGADPQQVRLQFSGAGRVRSPPTAISSSGRRPPRCASGAARLSARRPGPRHRAQPLRAARRRHRRVRARPLRSPQGARHRSDPQLLRLLGGSGLDEAASVAVDAAGNVYVAGTTSSPGFPGAPGSPGGIDLFVTKLDARGSSVLFSTYIGGSGVDEARGMTIDGLGNVYVVGTTTSANFPTVSPRQAALRGRVRRLPAAHLDDRRRPQLLDLLRRDGRRRGECDRDRRGTEHVHRGDDALVGLSLLNPAQAYQGQLDGFVSKFAAAGTLVYSTYPRRRRHGHAGGDRRRQRRQRQHDGLHDLPPTCRCSTRCARPSGGRVDAFFSRFSAAGSILFCSYFGGSGNDAGRAVAVFPWGPAFIAGSTTSPDFPVASAPQPAFGGGMDAFLVLVSETGALATSTYYGGTRSERGRALALNQAGKLIFSGQTFSPDLPVVRAAQPRTGGNRDTFVVELDSPYTAFTYATYLGGSNNDEGSGVAVDRVGRVFTAGAASYPSPGALGASDAFIYGISSGLAGVDTDGDGLDDEWETQFGTDPNTNDAAGDPDGDGFTNAQERANNTHPTGYFTRFLAEGSTGAFFDDRIALFNPGLDLATVVLRFQRDAGAELQQVLAIPSRSRATVNPETIVGLENAAFATVDREQPVGGRRPHDDLGRERVRQPRRDLDRAAGDDLVPGRRLNLPSISSTCCRIRTPARPQVTITFLRPSGGPVDEAYTVGPRSRRTINIDTSGLHGTAGRPSVRCSPPTSPPRSSRPTACRSWSSARCT